MKSIDGRARTVRELLDAAKYTIDFYQKKFPEGPSRLAGLCKGCDW
ncbi:MAG: hypothetical protein K8R59_04335 [Thermoanaerobaculales bacterium]|nr:hypothetical protein [Thermoanaerobaculales bacterium]